MKNIIKAEWRKKRSTVFLIPLLVGSLLIFAICGSIMLSLTKNGQSIDRAFEVLYELCVTNWNYLVILVVITFSLLTTEMEHRLGMWPTLLTTPHSKWKHFFVKVITAVGFIQLFGLCVCLYLSGLGFLYGKSFFEYIKISLELLYLPFLLAIPFVITQTLISIIIVNPYISVGIGMAVFLFHAMFALLVASLGSTCLHAIQYQNNRSFSVTHFVVIGIWCIIHFCFLPKNVFFWGGVNW
nr:ABC transporter permease [Bacillus subtilis]